MNVVFVVMCMIRPRETRQATSPGTQPLKTCQVIGSVPFVEPVKTNLSQWTKSCGLLQNQPIFEMG
jgi:hypothetical protein